MISEAAYLDEWIGEWRDIASQLDIETEFSDLAIARLRPDLKIVPMVTSVNTFQGSTVDKSLWSVVQEWAHHEGHTVAGNGARFPAEGEETPLSMLCRFSAEKREVYRRERIRLLELQRLAEAAEVEVAEKFAKESANSAIGGMLTSASILWCYVMFTAVTQTASFLTTNFMMHYEVVGGNMKLRYASDIFKLIEEVRAQANEWDKSDELYQEMLAEIITPSAEQIANRYLGWVVPEARVWEKPNLCQAITDYIESCPEELKKLLWLRFDNKQFYQSWAVVRRLSEILDWIPGNANWQNVLKMEDCWQKERAAHIIAWFQRLVPSPGYLHKYCDPNWYATSSVRRYVLHADTDSNMLLSGNVFIVNRTRKAHGLPPIEYNSELFVNYLKAAIMMDTSLIPKFVDSFLALLGVPEDRRTHVNAKFEYLYLSFMPGMSRKRHISLAILQDGAPVKKVIISGFDIVKAVTPDAIRVTGKKLLSKTLEDGPDRKTTMLELEDLKELMRATVQDHHLPTFFRVYKVKPEQAYAEPDRVYTVAGSKFWDEVLSNGSNKLEDLASAFITAVEFTSDRMAIFNQMYDADNPPVEPDEEYECWFRVKQYLEANPVPTKWASIPKEEKIPLCLIPFVSMEWVYDQVDKLLTPVHLANWILPDRVIPPVKNGCIDSGIGEEEASKSIDVEDEEMVSLMGNLFGAD